MTEWLKLTSDDIKQLDRNLPVLIPIGLIEAHGPHLPVSVDVDSSKYFARAAAEKTGVILAPEIVYGFADEMREYPGTLGVSVETCIAVITDICKMLCMQRFKKVIFITGHGANKIPCQIAFYKVLETYPDFKGACWNWWSDCNITGIHHADKGETEVAMAIGTPAFMDRVKDFNVEKTWYQIRSRYEINPESGGINGYPSQADLKNGELLRDKALKVLVSKIMEAIAS